MIHEDDEVKEAALDPYQVLEPALAAQAQDNDSVQVIEDTCDDVPSKMDLLRMELLKLQQQIAHRRSTRTQFGL